MKTPKKYSLMGQIVTVAALYKPRERMSRENADVTRTWDIVPLVVRRAGWVVRYGHVMLGEMKYYMDEGTTWNCTGALPCLWISWWPNRKPVPVPVDAVAIGGEPRCVEWDWPTGEPGERLRKEFASYAAEQPRSNGRFVKKTYAKTP